MLRQQFFLPCSYIHATPLLALSQAHWTLTTPPAIMRRRGSRPPHARRADMKLSIFPQKQGLTNWTLAEQKELNTLNDLALTICNNIYSGSIFKNNYANNENFLSTDFIILDYDNNPDDPQLPLGAAIDVFKPYKHIIAPTRSHQKEKHNHTADRFRVVLFLSTPITDEATYLATWQHVAKLFPGLDQNCKDPARRLFSSTSVTSINETGLTIQPVSAPEKFKPKWTTVVDGAITNSFHPDTLLFMVEGAKPGTWNHELFKAAKDYQENGYDKDQFIQRAERITGHLDAKDLTTINSAFKRPAKRLAEEEQEEDYAKAEKWVREWLTNKHASQSYKTGVLTVGGEETPGDLLLSTLVLDAISWAEKNPITDARGNEKQRAPYSQPTIEHVLTKWLAEQDKANIDTFKSHLAHSPSAQGTGLVAWVRAVTGAAREEDIAVVRHFIWQVKRKLHHLPVEHHMMPVIYGATGSGKTRAVEALLGPVEEFMVAPQDLAVLGDSREAAIFGRFYIAFFDEMARADKLDVAALKNKITSQYVTHRKLGTNIQITKRNSSTFIGASNNQVEAIINDPTSARRFWQLESQPRIDWSTINSIDYLDLWRSVSEVEACPLAPYLSTIQTVQNEELRSKSFVEQWAQDFTEPCEGGFKAKLLYESFMEWGAWQGIRAMPTFMAFGLELKRLGFKKGKNREGVHYFIRPKSANSA